MSPAPKYGPLRDHLAALPASQHWVDLDFATIEALVGGLPASAWQLRQWWANDSKVQACAWREAGWHVDTVNQARGRVRFARGRVGGARIARRGGWSDA